MEQESKKIAEYLINLAKEIGAEPVRRACRIVLKQRNLGYDKTPRKKPKKDWLEIKLKQQGGVCQYCKEPLNLEDAVFDHIQSLNKGGKHSFSNGCASCVSCNSSKSDRTLVEQSKKTGKTILEQIS